MEDPGHQWTDAVDRVAVGVEAPGPTGAGQLPQNRSPVLFGAVWKTWNGSRRSVVQHIPGMLPSSSVYSHYSGIV